jgi:hypothetical protein
MLKPITQTTVFLLEIVMLVAYACYGYSLSTNTFLSICLAAILVLATILIWALWAAPTAKRRLNLPALVMFRGALFLLAACFLFYLGHDTLAVIVEALAISTQIICYYQKH